MMCANHSSRHNDRSGVVGVDICHVFDLQLLVMTGLLIKADEVEPEVVALQVSSSNSSLHQAVPANHLCFTSFKNDVYRTSVRGSGYRR
jgi:hypothetical protein